MEEIERIEAALASAGSVAPMDVGDDYEARGGAVACQQPRHASRPVAPRGGRRAASSEPRGARSARVRGAYHVFWRFHLRGSAAGQSTLRPLARRRLSTFWPLVSELRARKPETRAFLRRVPMEPPFLFASTMRPDSGRAEAGWRTATDGRMETPTRLAPIVCMGGAQRTAGGAITAPAATLRGAALRTPAQRTATAALTRTAMVPPAPAPPPPVPG
eukprot:CAMPEP_0183792762 /NCGR_PEP_ID=MMETSP0803_2-20130417/2775_1 /TAXON_ID=195967 /ORGANISM="Crustomastix stigmata, Strain CCMP3273" /LENGTH=216 /DNA_ID=CAMNT_0026037129 /DNA_START=16 /DNA_END=664 /DNA_ORIENTATION=-